MPWIVSSFWMLLSQLAFISNIIEHKKASKVVLFIDEQELSARVPMTPFGSSYKAFYDKYFCLVSLEGLS